MFTRIRLRTIGSDGYFTLLLSNLVLLASGGVMLLVLLVHVVRTARSAGCAPASTGSVLVLGHVLRQGKPSPQFIARLERARTVSAAAPQAAILVLGGKTAADTRSEAEAGRDYLLDRGLPPEQVIIEGGSRHTLENLQHARPLLAPGQPPVLISNRFHLARCGVFARGVGLYAELCAAEESLRLTPMEWLRMLTEAYLLHWYYVGRSWSRLTANQRSLARIS